MMRRSYSWKEILNDRPCTMILTNLVKTLSIFFKDLHQMKLKTDSQWIHLVEVYLFRVEHMIKWTMVLLIRTPRQIDIGILQKRDEDQFFYDHRNKKLTTRKLCGTVWRDYSPKEILNGGPCATNLTKSDQIAFKRNWRIHQTKLETDSRNGFTSSRCIFFM
jgi:hypothetical protein